MKIADDKMPRRLKIAVLSRVFSPTGGGAERYSVEIAMELARRHEVHVFAQESTSEVASVQMHHIARWFKKPRWINQLWYAYATWHATKQGFDIVHSHENVWHGNVQTMHVKTTQKDLLGDRLGWRLLLRWLKILCSPRLLTYLAFEHARMAYRTRRAIVATSQTLQLELRKYYPNSVRMLHTVEPGVGLRISHLSKNQARQMLGLDVAGRKILFVANDYARKGLAALLQALVHLPSDIHLIVVGNPQQQANFEKQVVQLDLESRVIFMGSLSDMGAAYQSADVLVHPTLEDSFAMVVLEAMAYHLPVIVSDSHFCGIASIITDGHDAVLLTDPQSASAIALSVLRVLDSKELVQSLILHGLALVQKRTWQKAACAYEAIYIELL